MLDFTSPSEPEDEGVGVAAAALASDPDFAADADILDAYSRAGSSGAAAVGPAVLRVLEAMK